MSSAARLTFWMAAVAFVAAAGVTSCEEDIVDVRLAPDSSVYEVLISPPSINLARGVKTTLLASVAGGPDLTDRSVIWSSSDTTVATVDSSGTVTAVTVGRASIIAAAHAHPL